MTFDFTTFSPKYETIDFEERINPIICKQLLAIPFEDMKKHYDECKSDKERKEYHDKIKSVLNNYIANDGCQIVTYTFPKNSPSPPQGNRLFGNGIQGLIGLFRGALMKHTTDIDMKNAHPVILRYICNIHNISCPQLEYYIRNRDKILASFPNRAEAKQLFLTSTNKGDKLKNKSNSFLTKYDMEMKEIQQQLLGLPEYSELDKYIDSETTYNINGKKINKILCVLENAILGEVIDFIKSRDIEISTLMFDGLMVYGNYYGEPALLRDLEAHIESRFNGLGMEFSYKEHDDSIKIKIDASGNPIDVGSAFDDAIQQIYKSAIYSVIMNPSDYNTASYIKNAFPTKYCYDNVNKKWYELDTYNKYIDISNSKECIDIRNFFRNFILDEMNKINTKLLGLQKNKELPLTDENKVIINDIIETIYKVQTKRIEKATAFAGIYEVICDLYANSNLHKLLDSYTNLFAFNNMLFDANSATFRPINPMDYISTHTGYDYISEVNKEAHDMVMNIIRNLFAYTGISDDELQTDIRQFLVYKATSLCADRTDKYQIFVINQGKGGNGKSLIDSIDSMAFGSYFTTCEYTIFTETPDKRGANPELLDFKGKRLISTSEVPINLKLNTTTLKRFCSDTVSARQVFSTVIQKMRIGLINFNINDEVKFSADDGGLRRRFKKNVFPISFVDSDKFDPSNPYMKLKDITILDKFRTNPALRMEYMRILINTYISLLYGDKELPVSKKHEEYVKEYLNKTNSVSCYFDDSDCAFTITNNDDDMVLINDIHDDYNIINKMEKLDKNTFAKNIEAMGLVRMKYKKREPAEFRDKMVVVGVTQKNKEVPAISCDIKDDDEQIGGEPAPVLTNIIKKVETITKVETIEKETPPTMSSRDKRRSNMRWENAK